MVTVLTVQILGKDINKTNTYFTVHVFNGSNQTKYPRRTTLKLSKEIHQFGRITKRES